MEDVGQKDTIFERIGGTTAIDRLVDLFYDRMDTLAEAKGIRAMHAADLGPTRDILKRYLSEWTGGPKLYSPEKGHPRLRQRHMHVEIGEEERLADLHARRPGRNRQRHGSPRGTLRKHGEARRLDAQ